MSFDNRGGSTLDGGSAAGGTAAAEVSAAILCKTGCGFYGNAAFEGMCSKCYKDKIKQQQMEKAGVAASSSPSPPMDKKSISDAKSLGALKEDISLEETANNESSCGDDKLSKTTADKLVLTAVEEISESAEAAACVASSKDNNSSSSSDSLNTGCPTVLTAKASSNDNVDKSSPNSEVVYEASASSLDKGSYPTTTTNNKVDDPPTTGTTTPQTPASSDSPTESPSTGDKPKRNRCLTCKKKVGLTGFECRCGGLFCSQHRYSDTHACDFDYREHGQELIRKNNPVVVSEKVKKL